MSIIITQLLAATPDPIITRPLARNWLLFLFLFPLTLCAQQETPHSFGVKIIGQGRPMILIPGLKGDGEGTYATTIAHYKDRYTCYVITLAGFAGQPASDRTSGLLMGQRDELLQYIRDRRMNKPVLVGFSFGGVLALWMASKEPALFGPVIDIDGAPYEAAMGVSSLNEDSLHKKIAATLDYMNSATPQMIAKYDSTQHSPQGMKKGFEFLKSMISDTTRIPLVLDWDKHSDVLATGRMIMEMTVLNLQDSVANIRSPLLVLGSWKGWEIFTSAAQASAAMKQQFSKAPDVKVVYSKEGRHFLMWNDFDWVIAEMDAFLK